METQNSHITTPTFLKPLSTKENHSFLYFFNYWSWIILIFASILQCILFLTITNILAVIIVTISWFILQKWFLNPETLNNYPISSFIVIGFSVTQLYFPLVFTLVEGRPITFNLKLSDEVFLHSILILIVLTISHQIYRSISKTPINYLRYFLKKTLFFKPPSDSQLWLMGIIGLLSTFYVYIYAKSALELTGSTVDKLLESLIGFTYAPYFIGLRRLYDENNKKNNNFIIKLAAYTILVFLVSIARNSRGAFMFGFTSLGYSYGLGLLLNVFKPSFINRKNVTIFIALLWLFTGPVADLGAAMVIVRNQRHEVSSYELLSLTLKAYENKSAINNYKLNNRSVGDSDWDEYYLDNIFLSRFCNIKFNDASLIEASKLGKIDTGFQDFSINRALAILPDPVIKMLGLDINKKLINYSFGDYLYAKSHAMSNDSNVIGVNRTGHVAGTGMAAFSWWYLAILAVAILPIFLLFDAFYIKVRFPNKHTIQPRISLCLLLAINSVFSFLPAESVMVIPMFLMRGWFQMLFLYYIMFYFTSMLGNLFTGKA